MLVGFRYFLEKLMLELLLQLHVLAIVLRFDGPQ